MDAKPNSASPDSSRPPAGIPAGQGDPAVRARASLPFARASAGSGEGLWPSPEALRGGNLAQRRLEGERWALEFLRYYREFGHEPGARVLGPILREGLASGTDGDEHLTGFLRVLDAMLAFAARHSDLDGYADALGVEHQRTLAAWDSLDGGR